VEKNVRSLGSDWPCLVERIDCTSDKNTSSGPFSFFELGLQSRCGSFLARLLLSVVSETLNTLHACFV
jgi:hypothetical protein